MKDIEIRLPNSPGALAGMGKALGDHHVSLEGGGVFEIGDHAVAHFLVEDAEKAREVLTSEGLEVRGVFDVIILKLRQDVPGQLGEFCQRLADARVNILTQYSDHSNQLVIVPDDFARAQEVADRWMKEWW